MANRAKQDPDEIDLGRHREITNTGGQPGRGGSPALQPDQEDERPERESGPEKAGLKEGDDAWHNRSNRSGERGEGAESGRGGNVAR
jgi:hypothetical protein